MHRLDHRTWLVPGFVLGTEESSEFERNMYVMSGNKWLGFEFRSRSMTDLRDNEARRKI
jgi:hypothetical protein